MAISDYYKTLVKLDTSEAEDGIGGVVITYTETEFQGVINQASSDEIELGNKLNIDVSSKLYCSVNESITYGDMIKEGSDTYRVASRAKNTMNRNHHYKFLLEKVDNNG